MDIQLRKAKIKDLKFLFNLRNKPYVYKNSGTPRKIQKQEHLDWFFNVLSGKANKELFIIEFEKKPVGQARFDSSERGITVNISLLKKFHGRGIAFLTLRKAIKKMSREKRAKTFLAEIHQENIASQKLFEKLGFQLQNQKGVWKKYEKRI